MEETYQLIEGSPTLRDLDAENGFLWCPFGCIERRYDRGILISRNDDRSYDVRLVIGFDGPERFAAGGSDWSWMDMAMDFTVDLAFADDMKLSDWISSETVATGAAWARCFNPDCGPADTLDVKEITAALKRFESPSYLARCPAWVECFPSYSEKAAQGEDDILKAVKQFRVEAKRTKKAAVPDRVPLIQFLGARTAAAKTGGGNDSGNGLHI